MKIALGTDHAGYLYKERIKEWLVRQGHARWQGAATASRTGLFDGIGSSVYELKHCTNAFPHLFLQALSLGFEQEVELCLDLLRALEIPARFLPSYFPDPLQRWFASGFGGPRSIGLFGQKSLPDPWIVGDAMHNPGQGY